MKNKTLKTILSTLLITVFACSVIPAHAAIWSGEPYDVNNPRIHIHYNYEGNTSKPGAVDGKYNTQISSSKLSGKAELIYEDKTYGFFSDSQTFRMVSAEENPNMATGSISDTAIVRTEDGTEYELHPIGGSTPGSITAPEPVNVNYSFSADFELIKKEGQAKDELVQTIEALKKQIAELNQKITALAQEIKALKDQNALLSAQNSVYQFRLSKPSFTVKRSKKKDIISIKPLKGANQYQVYRATSKTGGFKLIKTVKTTKIAISHKANKKYYYAIKAINNASASSQRSKRR